MTTHNIEYRVIYGDTDAMSMVYYANYLRFYEMGRSEFMRNLGFPYAQLADMGIECPAVSLCMSYKRSARFDDLITIETRLKEMPRASMTFIQRILRHGELLNEAEINLCFLDMKRQKPVRCPAELNIFLSKHIF